MVGGAMATGTSGSPIAIRIRDPEAKLPRYAFPQGLLIIIM
jgi:hypothetical protein